MPARSARHGRAARGDARPSRDSRRAPRPRRASTARTCTRAGGSIPSRRRGRLHAAPGRAAHARLSSARRLLRRSAAGRRRARDRDRRPTSCGRAVPGLRLEEHRDATPGVDRLEVEGLDGAGRRSSGRDSCRRSELFGRARAAHELRDDVVHGLIGERELDAAQRDDREAAGRHVRRCADVRTAVDRRRPRSPGGSRRRRPAATRSAMSRMPSTSTGTRSSTVLGRGRDFDLVAQAGSRPAAGSTIDSRASGERDRTRSRRDPQAAPATGRRALRRAGARRTSRGSRDGLGDDRLASSRVGDFDGEPLRRAFGQPQRHARRDALRSRRRAAAPATGSRCRRRRASRGRSASPCNIERSLVQRVELAADRAAPARAPSRRTRSASRPAGRARAAARRARLRAGGRARRRSTAPCRRRSAAAVNEPSSATASRASSCRRSMVAPPPAERSAGSYGAAYRNSRSMLSLQRL